MSERFVIAAGGTGGHLFPAQALANELIARGHQVTVITDDRGLRWKDSFEGADMRSTRSATTARRGLVGKLSAMMTIIGATLSNVVLLGKLKPAVVVGFGGYPSIPPMLAAIIRRTPRAIHEQNGVMGRANRALSPHMTAIAVTLPHPQGMPEKVAHKQVHVGNPVRPEVVKQARKKYKSPGEEGTISLLVFGGSQGATILSDVVPEAINLLPPELKARLHICQQARDEDLARVRDAYATMEVAAEVEAFYNDLPQRMAAAHLVISRSGASTVCELMVMGRPSILVPLPQALDGDQAANAKYLVEEGGAWLMPQAEMTADRLTALLKEILSDAGALSGAASSARELGRPKAAQDLADLVESLARGSKEDLGKGWNAATVAQGEDT